ncbi:MAG: peptidylprolyl isomerase [Ignavibacteria bacterium]|nr:peptidylprolyl isomerase [Ignavibacteria bacterium]
MNKKKYYFHVLSLLIISLVTVIVACSSKKKIVLAEIGDEKLYLHEYEDQFLKTTNNIDSARNKSIEEKKDFLDLLIKFRLKVRDARDRGLLNATEIQQDLNEYKKNFVSTFLIDKEVVEPNIKQLYERKKYEVRASHILVNLSQTATVEDSLKAYQKADLILKKLEDEDFETVARTMSDDKTAQQNGGDLYYFTGGMTVEEFEEVVYELNVSEITKEPVRTMFGLHIVKLTDKRKRNDGIRASHILIQDKKDSLGNITDSVGTFNRAMEILKRIKNGEDFATVAKEVSEDPGSKDNGGDLGFFDRRRMVQPFDSAAFSLEVGEVSDLVRTPFGWHIIKLTEIKEFSPFEEQKETLKTEFKRGQMFRAAYTKYMESAREDYNFAIDPNGLKFLITKFDSTKTINEANVDSLFTGEDRKVVLATFKDGQIIVEDMVQYLNTNRDYGSNAPITKKLVQIIEGASEMPILNLIAVKENIEDDEDYKKLLADYEDGLLTFKIDQEELWSKIKINDEEMQKYYDTHKADYTIKENNEDKVRPFEEVKSEISSKLQQEKFKELETAYIDSLKQKYPVVIHEEILAQAFEKE